MIDPAPLAAKLYRCPPLEVVPFRPRTRDPTTRTPVGVLHDACLKDSEGFLRSPEDPRRFVMSPVGFWSTPAGSQWSPCGFLRRVLADSYGYPKDS
eukprot:1518439-Pyramimonas_sp.AAC.1